MPRQKRANTGIRAELYSDLERGALSLGQPPRRMRKIIGVTQTEYQKKVLKIFPRVLMGCHRHDFDHDHRPYLPIGEKTSYFWHGIRWRSFCFTSTYLVLLYTSRGPF